MEELRPEENNHIPYVESKGQEGEELEWLVNPNV
jgi:hypothetical protein